MAYSRYLLRVGFWPVWPGCFLSHFESSLLIKRLYLEFIEELVVYWAGSSYMA
jgi:hypothetical protein